MQSPLFICNSAASLIARICNTHIDEFRKRAREIEAAGIKEVIVFHSSLIRERKMDGNKRFMAVDPKKTTAKNKEVFQAIQNAFGRIPNSFKVLANSETFLAGYWNFDQALEHGKLSPITRNEIAIAVSQINKCPYCLSAFTAIGQGAGISDHELEQCRLANSEDPKVDAALKFAKAIVMERGAVSDQDFAKVRDAGYTDTEIMEIVANVALITCANYINLVSQTEIDFPLVTPEKVTSN